MSVEKVKVKVGRSNASPVLQTDVRLSEIDKDAAENIRKWGCLFRSLQFLVEMKKETFLTPEEIIDLYHRAVHYKLMKKNCFVKDHRGIIRDVQRAFDIKEDGSYLYRKGDDHEFDNGGKPNAFILEIDTDVENYNHFLVANEDDHTLWDPYFPYLKRLGILSRRGYSV